MPEWFPTGWVALFALLIWHLLWRGSQRTKPPAPPPVATIQMDDGVLLAFGWPKQELAHSIEEFSAQYRTKKLNPHFQNIAAGTYQVRFPDGILPAELMFLINYFRFPKSSAATLQTTFLCAETTLNEGFGAIGEALFDQEALIFAPINDSELDSVHIMTRKGSYAVSLATMSARPISKASMPPGLIQLSSLAADLTRH